MGERSIRPFVLAAFVISGASALVYEVVWTRALSLVLGSTVYALSTMLATFMAGLAVGSFLGGRLCDRRNDHLLMFAVCELAIGIGGLLSIPLIYQMPVLYLSLYRGFHLYPQLFLALQAGLCALVMFVPTVFMGATFPVVSRIVTTGIDQMGRGVGNAYFANTIGAVVGSVCAGFVLIPMIGVKGTAFAAAGMNIVAAVCIFAIAGRVPRRIYVFIPAFVLCGAILARAEQHPAILNFYSVMRHNDSKLPFRAINAIDKEQYKELFRGDYAEGMVKAFRYSDGSLVLQVGGKIEGTTLSDLANTVLLSYLPIASHESPRDFLTIGLGAGVTLGAAKDHLKHVDLVEINPGVIEAIRLHGPPGLLDNVSVIQNDARNYLLSTNKRYDIISSEPSYPSESSVASLFTRDFYMTAAERLKEGGVYCQWLPYYFLANDDVSMMLKTFSSVFPHVFLWKVSSSLDLIMVGSKSRFTFSADEIRARVEKLNLHGYPLDYTLSRSPQQIQDTIANAALPINTDDRPILEYAVIKNMIRGNLE